MALPLLGVSPSLTLCCICNPQKGIAFVCKSMAWAGLCPDYILWELEEYT